MAARVSSLPRRRWYHAGISTKAPDPLRILFCGSDAFSCESLNVLHREHVENPGLVESLDVMVRPPKRTGRGLKQFREGKSIFLKITCANSLTNMELVPCKLLAENLGLTVHERDTFRGWSVSVAEDDISTQRNSDWGE
jgi:methionyl-tRNA formyltransferase